MDDFDNRLFAVIRVVMATTAAGVLALSVVVPIVAKQLANKSFQHGSLLVRTSPIL